MGSDRRLAFGNASKEEENPVEKAHENRLSLPKTPRVEKSG